MTQQDVEFPYAIPPGADRKEVVRTWAVSVYLWEMTPRQFADLVDKLYTTPMEDQV